MQSIVTSIKSHIKDTTDFIRKIEAIRDLPENTILVTMEVKSLFTNIPHTDGTNAVARALEKIRNESTPTRVIFKFLSLTLHINNFVFNRENYLQKKASQWEASALAPRRTFLWMTSKQNTSIHGFLAITCAIFALSMIYSWYGLDPKKISSPFSTKLTLSIKFDCQYSFNSINFLDTTVYKNKHNSLYSKLFAKPTDRPAYLHRNSSHPNSLIKNIPYGQALRVKRICSEVTDLQEALDESPWRSG